MADARARLAILKALKNSDPEKAIHILEILLDGDIVGINGYMAASIQKKELAETLSKVAEYRAESNYRSTAPLVTSILRRASEEAGSSYCRGKSGHTSSGGPSTLISAYSFIQRRQ
ncbi:hypothetical protein FNU76_19400 [Chitinimonas arctica]|uniref:Uncharacterized protein n=1 Tax=Chitinimonas arctica TaxID=2594795 RepID=A0A516SJK1_9NEIS|nr:hypothetical protein [Chitinimonas arctica]QDQ28342.1 hypothetical protein FNU76_19400 [Chitinimonas arctica]